MFLVAGPCAAESEEQVLATARALCPYNPVFRAGLWKPRSQPDTYQGAGEKGLAWLQRVERETGLRTATEVATPGQLLMTLQAGIPYLWIGARTASNPIAVQALADALRQALAEGKAQGLQGIMVKNAMHEDAPLWAGNIRRMQEAVAGHDVGVWAVHRGCNHRPCWEMAYALRGMMPDVPMLIDPSHMSGDAGQIAPLCEKALALDYDGQMIEVHPSPADALSDARQQITPYTLGAILHTLRNAPAQPSDELPLRWLRAMMDEVDDALWETINRRMAISRRIGEWKRQQGVPVRQPARFEDILCRRIKEGERNGLSRETVTAICHALHEESIRQQ
ncbi:MAG: bifunctional 3-deoxy-7-phosphoheptulonate synthase/chorismate mutase type II [Paludibacteraceae bacterium]|nr:bifunctional 3-deoxy-7-phosphoheptulonate synthase/chorismate mutase type II [Paludibacteraceae bacterium]